MPCDLHAVRTLPGLKKRAAYNFPYLAVAHARMQPDCTACRLSSFYPIQLIRRCPLQFIRHHRCSENEDTIGIDRWFAQRIPEAGPDAVNSLNQDSSRHNSPHDDDASPPYPLVLHTTPPKPILRDASCYIIVNNK